MESLSCTSWYLFKDPDGSPMLFYNSETGEHRCVGKYQNVQVEQVPITKVQHTSLRKVVIPKRNGKLIKTVSTQTEQNSDEQKQTLHFDVPASLKALSQEHTPVTTKTEQDYELLTQTSGNTASATPSNFVSQNLTQYNGFQKNGAIKTSNLISKEHPFLGKTQLTTATTPNISLKGQHIFGPKDVTAATGNFQSNAATTSQFSLKECLPVGKRDVPAKTTNSVSREQPHLPFTQSNAATSTSQFTSKKCSSNAPSEFECLQLNLGCRNESTPGTSPRNPSSTVYDKRDNDINQACSYLSFQTGDKSNHQSSVELENDDGINDEEEDGTYQKSSLVINKGSTNLDKTDDYSFDAREFRTKESLTGNLFAMEISSVITDEDLQPARTLSQDYPIVVSLGSANTTPNNCPKTHADEVQEACHNLTSKTEMVLEDINQTIQGPCYKALQQNIFYENEAPGPFLDVNYASSSSETPQGLQSSRQSPNKSNLDSFQPSSLRNPTLEDTPQVSKDGFQTVHERKCTNASKERPICESVTLNSALNATHKTRTSCDNRTDLKNSRRSNKGKIVNSSKRKHLRQTNLSDKSQDVTNKRMCNDSQKKLRNSQQSKRIKKKKRGVVNVDASHRKSLGQELLSNKSSNSMYDLTSNDTKGFLEDSCQSARNESPRSLYRSGASSIAKDTTYNVASMDSQVTSVKSLRTFISNEDKLFLELIEKEIDKELELNDLEPPPSVNVKEEPNDDNEEKNPDNQTCDYPISAEDFRLVDLLPKKKRRDRKCEFCDMSFPRSESLKRHINYLHPEEATSNPRRHACTICKKRFVERDSLKDHMRIHSGEKPFRCSHCGKCFSQLPNLNRHTYIHTGQRPHKCKDCGKAFRQKTHLAIHVRIHAGVKPYQCGQCSKTYRTRSHLLRHLKSSSHEGVIVREVSSMS